MTRIDELRQPHPNQAEIDAEAAAMLRDTWCELHQRAYREYADGVEACPECEAYKSETGQRSERSLEDV